MSVKGLDTREQLAVVSTRDEDLVVVPDGGLEDGEWPGGEFVLLDLCDFVLCQVVARLCQELSEMWSVIADDIFRVRYGLLDLCVRHVNVSM